MPRAITGPEPSACLVIRPSSTPGWSVAKVTSTTIATSGSSANALVRAPANVVSSWTTASANTSPGAPPAARHQPGRLGGDVAADAVVERPRDEPVVAAAPAARRRSPRRRRSAPASRASSPSVAPMSMCRSLSLGDLLAVLVLRAGGSACGRSRRARARHASRARTRWPTSIDRIPAADLPEAQIALVLDVGDVEADLVDVADHRQRRAARRFRGRGRTTSRRDRRRPRRRTRAHAHARPARARSRGRTGRPRVSRLSSSSGVGTSAEGYPAG